MKTKLPQLPETIPEQWVQTKLNQERNVKPGGMYF